jgi:glycosyltransferase involved in cell wall biosynthesis
MHVAINALLVSFGASYRNAGVSRYTYRLVEGLARAGGGDRYTVFVAGREAAAVRPLSREDFRLVPGGWRTEQPLRRVLWERLALARAVRRVRADVFHSPVNVLPPRLPCPAVVTIHDLAFLHYPQFFRPARRAYQRALTVRSARAATRVIAVSECTRRDLVRLGVDPARVRVVYPAVEERFRPEADAGRLAAFRRAHGLPERYLLYLGTLEPRKNLGGLLEAYARMRARDAGAPALVIAGAKGWYYDEVFARVRALGIERAVSFAGYVDDADQPLWYAAAELFIYPSWFEGFGLPVAEAMACGTPVITSEVSSLPEVAGDAAVLVDPRDAEALAHAMQTVCADAQTRRRLALAGPRQAQRFSAGSMIQGCREVYVEAVGGAARRQVVVAG